MATASILSGNSTHTPGIRPDIRPVPEPSNVQVDGAAAESIISEKRIG